MSFAEILAHSTVLYITIVMMLIGLVFTIIPPLPGTLLIWVAALFYGWSLGWEALGWVTVALLTFFMIVGITADVLAGHFGAKIGGASCSSVAVGGVFGLGLGVASGFSGIPVLSCVGGLVGSMGGILLMERWQRGDWQAALQATKGYLAGSALGAMAKVTSGVFMITIFFVAISWGV